MDSAISHPRESRPPGWRLPSVRRSEGSANRGGRPRRTRSTWRPSGDQTISSTVLDADNSVAICRARSFAARAAGKSSRRSESRGISLASTRAKLQIAPQTRPDVSPVSDDCWASEVMTQSSERRSAAWVASRARAAICCEASSVGSPRQEPSAMKRIVGGDASLPLRSSNPSAKEFAGPASVTRWPASASRSCTMAASAASPATTETERGSPGSQRKGSWRGRAVPHNMAHGQGVQALDAASADRNPAAASSVHHSSAERRGDPSLPRDRASHHPGPWPNTMSQSGFGSGSTATKTPLGAKSFRRSAKPLASSPRRAQAFTARTMSKPVWSSASIPSCGDHRRAVTPSNDSARNESRALCSASPLVAT